MAPFHGRLLRWGGSPHPPAGGRGSPMAKSPALLRGGGRAGGARHQNSDFWGIAKGPPDILEVTCFTLLAAAVAEKERHSMPLLGDSTDRRNLSHVGEVLNEDTTSVLICFICACKHIQHQGYNMFGHATEKGKINYYTGLVALAKTEQQITSNGCRQTD